jgi:hypothetical protein
LDQLQSVVGAVAAMEPTNNKVTMVVLAEEVVRLPTDQEELEHRDRATTVAVQPVVVEQVAVAVLDQQDLL